MAELDTIDIEPKHLKMVKSVFARYLPYKQVWAYGSRVKWTAGHASDLDCVIFNATYSEIYNAQEAFDESDIPFEVQLLNWETIPDDFKKNIKKGYFVLRNKGDWSEFKLGDIVTLHYGKSLPTTKRTDGNIPVYSSAGLTGWHNKPLVKSEALIIGRKGTIGKVYKTKIPFFAIDTAYYILPDENKYNFNYLYYILLELRLNELNEDSAVPGLNRTAAYSCKITLPTLPEQKAIAAVLSSLDDKIDLLHRQNKTLEAIAETIFRQWFVEEADDSWEEGSLSKIADYLNGLACQNHLPKNDFNKLPVLKIKDLKNGLSKDSDWATSDVKKEYIVKNGDIVFSWSASLLVKIWSGEACVLNQHLFKVTSDQYPKWFIYLWTNYHLEKFIAIAESKATTMGHIKRTDLDNAIVTIPSNAEIEYMDKTIKPVIDKIIINNSQIKTLETLRNTILPKLISGDIRVEYEVTS